MAARDQPGDIPGRTVGGAERCPKPSFGFFPLKKLDHPMRPPDILPAIFAILHTGAAEKFQPPFAQLAAGVLKHPLEVGYIAMALICDNNVATGLSHRLRHEVISSLIIRCGVDKI